MDLYDLPIELLIRILSVLPIRTIFAFERVSRFSLELVRENDAPIYQVAAALHGFIKPNDRVLADIVGKPDVTGWLDGVTSWKELVRRHFLRRKAWNDQQKPSNPVDPSMKFCKSKSIQHVWRFSVDSVERTVICTTTGGGAWVVSVDNDEVLWSLPEWHIPDCAGFQYDHGFIVFTSLASGIELWRRSSDSFNPSTYLPCSPDEAQLEASPYAVPAFPATYPPVYPHPPRKNGPSLRQAPARGVYLPFSNLGRSEGGQSHHGQYPNSIRGARRSLRFKYPHLLVQSSAVEGGWVYDVRTSTVVDTIDLSSNGGVSMEIVDFNESFVVVWTNYQVFVYHRLPVDEGSSLAFSIDLHDLVSPDPMHIVCEGLGSMPTFVVDFDSSWSTDSIRARLPELTPNAFTSAIKAKKPSNANRGAKVKKGVILRSLSTFECFCGIQLSPDGNDLVAITREGWLIYVPDLHIIDAAKERTRRPFRLVFSAIGSNEITNLAFDGKRIILVVDFRIVCIKVRGRISPNVTSADGFLP